MKSLLLDKIASVTGHCQLDRKVKISDEYRCREGDVVAVRILNRKTQYNRLELPSGRFSTLNPGDIVAGALGHRRALNGYAGHLPRSLSTGDTIQVLNLGGVLGICDASHPDLGSPFSCEVLGQVLHFPYLGERIGVPATLKNNSLPQHETLDVRNVPVIAVVGTCMNAGKTAAASMLIQELTHMGLSIHGAKATGVSLRRDVLAMEDAGAIRTLSFTDFGIVTTTRENAALATRSMLTALAEDEPDAIVLELGDGLMGDYGVDSILADPDLRRAFSSVVLAANDPVGAWGGVTKLQQDFQIETSVVTGPATDNVAGTDVIEQRLQVKAINARSHSLEFARTLASSAGLHRSVETSS